MKCPKGYVFGKEHDQHEECDDCENHTYSECCKAYVKEVLDKRKEGDEANPLVAGV